MALIKTEILTSSKVLYTKSCKSNQFLFFFLVFPFFQEYLSFRNRTFAFKNYS